MADYFSFAESKNVIFIKLHNGKIFGRETIVMVINLKFKERKADS